ncbi:10253_t:CDS:2, partial [Scutellospora calospora]
RLFNDTMQKLIDIYMTLVNPEYGSSDELFIRDNHKLISKTAPVNFLDELDLQEQEMSNLQKFCSLVTGFLNPRNNLK